jgi:hypothetical protein
MATLAEDLITISLQLVFLTKKPALGLLVYSELWPHVSTAATPTAPYCHRHDGLSQKGRSECLYKAKPKAWLRLKTKELEWHE